MISLRGSTVHEKTDPIYKIKVIKTHRFKNNLKKPVFSSSLARKKFRLGRRNSNSSSKRDVHWLRRADSFLCSDWWDLNFFCSFGRRMLLPLVILMFNGYKELVCGRGRGSGVPTSLLRCRIWKSSVALSGCVLLTWSNQISVFFFLCRFEIQLFLISILIYFYTADLRVFSLNFLFVLN